MDSTATGVPSRTWAEVDLDAVRHNVRALKRRTRGTRLMAVVKADFDDFTLFALDARVEAYAVAAMEISRLRATDALHIGTAKAAYVDLFLTADKRQARAAQAVGLTTELIEA